MAAAVRSIRSMWFLRVLVCHRVWKMMPIEFQLRLSSTDRLCCGDFRLHDTAVAWVVIASTISSIASTISSIASTISSIASSITSPIHRIPQAVTTVHRASYEVAIPEAGAKTTLRQTERPDNTDVGVRQIESHDSVVRVRDM